MKASYCNNFLRMQTALRRRADSTAVLHRRELVPPTAQEEDCVATLYSYPQPTCAPV